MAVVLQRTTNNRQVRRLIAAVVPPRVIKKHGGFVAENHTILMLPSQQSAQFRLLCRLLNTNAVDRRYRRVAGTASISISSLRDLLLPKPQHLSAAVKRFAISNELSKRLIAFHRNRTNNRRKQRDAP